MISSSPKTASGWLACIAVASGAIAAIHGGVALHERPALLELSAQTAHPISGVVRRAVTKGLPSERHKVIQIWDGNNINYECRVRSIECANALPISSQGKRATIYLVDGRIVKTVVEGVATDTHAYLLASNGRDIKLSGVLIAIAAVLAATAYGLRQSNSSTL